MLKALVLYKVRIKKKYYKMKDITKCKGNECPLKESCKRYKAKGYFMKPYGIKPPYKLNGIGNQFVKCDLFIKYYSIN